jgi:hypothetical protein
MDPVLLPPLVGSPSAHPAERLRKNAEAYGDSLGIESLNATVLVEFPLSKGRISLRFPASAALPEMPKKSIKSNIKAVHPSALIHAGEIE